MEPRRFSLASSLLALALAAAPSLRAQEQTGPAPGPEQVRLAPWIGMWDLTVTNYEHEQPMTMKGFESTTPVCGGLWLKSTIKGVDVKFEGMSFTGWDANEGKYRGVWIDSMTSAASVSSGTYDEKTKTYSFEGTMQTPEGEVRTHSKLHFDGDTRMEVVEAVQKDGSKKKIMEIRSVRRGEAKAETVTSEPLELGTPSPRKPEHDVLARYTGKWDSTMTMTGPDGTATPLATLQSEETLVCESLWIETHVTGDIGGAPFEGYGLLGYDGAKKKFVNYWIDSMAPYMAASTGAFDAKAETMTLHGEGIDMAGQPVAVLDTTKFDGKDHRVITMVNTNKKDGKQSGSMTIDCKRKK